MAVTQQRTPFELFMDRVLSPGIFSTEPIEEKGVRARPLDVLNLGVLHRLDLACLDAEFNPGWRAMERYRHDFDPEGTV